MMSVRLQLIIVITMQHVSIQSDHLRAHVMLAILEMELIVKVKKAFSSFEHLRECHEISSDRK